MKNNYIVCAALRKEGVIIAGPRHFDSTMRSQINAINKGPAAFANAEQGFVDKRGNFWGRVDAMLIARANNQNIDFTRNGSKTSLYSEGLY